MMISDGGYFFGPPCICGLCLLISYHMLLCRTRYYAMQVFVIYA